MSNVQIRAVVVRHVEVAFVPYRQMWVIDRRRDCRVVLRRGDANPTRCRHCALDGQHQQQEDQDCAMNAGRHGGAKVTTARRPSRIASCDRAPSPKVPAIDPTRAWERLHRSGAAPYFSGATPPLAQGRQQITVPSSTAASIGQSVLRQSFGGTLPRNGDMPAHRFGNARTGALRTPFRTPRRRRRTPHRFGSQMCYLWLCSRLQGDR